MCSGEGSQAAGRGKAANNQASQAGQAFALFKQRLKLPPHRHRHRHTRTPDMSTHAHLTEEYALRMQERERKQQAEVEPANDEASQAGHAFELVKRRL